MLEVTLTSLVLWLWPSLHNWPHLAVIIQLLKPSQVASDHDTHTSQVWDLEHFVCLAQQACSVHGSMAEDLIK